MEGAAVLRDNPGSALLYNQCIIQDYLFLLILLEGPPSVRSRLKRSFRLYFCTDTILAGLGQPVLSLL